MCRVQFWFIITYVVTLFVENSRTREHFFDIVRMSAKWKEKAGPKSWEIITFLFHSFSVSNFLFLHRFPLSRWRVLTVSKVGQISPPTWFSKLCPGIAVAGAISWQYCERIKGGRRWWREGGKKKKKWEEEEKEGTPTSQLAALLSGQEGPKVNKPICRWRGRRLIKEGFASLTLVSHSNPWKNSYFVSKKNPSANPWSGTAVAAVYLSADSSRRDTKQARGDTKRDRRKWDLTCLSRNRWEVRGGRDGRQGDTSQQLLYVGLVRMWPEAKEKREDTVQ